MICFHGSYCEIKEPSIQFSRDKLDFGKGFYVTPIEAQAINWGARFKRMGKNSVVNTYEFGYEEVLINGKVLTFHEYSLEWLEFIINCRNGGDEYLKYDVIAGGIADDKVFNTVELYLEGLISKEETLGKLKYHKPNFQICIVNQDVIDKYLIFKESRDI